MAYDKNPTWVDGPAGETPITAVKLNKMETGIDQAHDNAAAAQAVADAAAVAAAAAQSTANDALALGTASGNVPDVELGIPDNYVLRTFVDPDGVLPSAYGWDRQAFNLEDSAVGQVPVITGAEEFWQWQDPPVGPHNHDGSYYTKAAADARYAAIGHNHSATYIAKGDVGSFDVLTAAEMAALIAGGTTVADRTYYVIG